MINRKEEMGKRLLSDMRDAFGKFRTPYYYYGTQLLGETLAAIKSETDKHEGWHLHYAVKACANPKVLSQIQQAGFGADCVSGGEIRTCLKNGFPASEIVFAGVGKADWEIELALEAGIQCFNVESIPELEVIAEIAERMGKVANVSFRINPDVGAHTHAHITTGLAENKFGIAKEDMIRVIRVARQMSGIRFVGLHFHIGSQILQMDDFQALCFRVNELQDQLEAEGITDVKDINVGGGLGIVLRHLCQVSEVASGTASPLRAGQSCRGAMRLAYHALPLCEADGDQRVRHRRCWHDGASSSCPLWRSSSDTEPQQHVSGADLRCGRTYLRKQRYLCPRLPVAADEARRPHRTSFRWGIRRDDGKPV